MALQKYKQKRDPSVTTEPFGGKSKDSKLLRFSVQKHAATRLHYDLRLEMDGVLKSWAIPKGPVMDPAIKRLAMMVEDHPYDYRDFEGIIPKGEYGAGTVIVWDEGTYEPSKFSGKTKKEKERHLLQSLESGQLKITLNGQKLKGEFALVQTKSQGDNSWLMIKHRDEFATSEDVTLLNKSVKSGKTIEELKQQENSGSAAKKEKSLQKPEKKTRKKDSGSLASIEAYLKKAVKSDLPPGLKPMLATLVDEPFDDPGWVFEVKWDGYRALGTIFNGKAELTSRNNKSFTAKYHPIVDELQKWPVSAIIDGEIMVLNDKGISDFAALQNWRSESDGKLAMYIFDILWYNGYNLMGLPLSDRQSVLREIFPEEGDTLRLSEVFPVSGKDFYQAAGDIGLEGIIAKKSDSIYTPDTRSKLWLKIKAQKRQEVVIGGYTINEGTGKHFSSLLLGVYEKKKLRFAGKVGTGFSDKSQKEMMKIFAPLVTDKNPFSQEIDVNQPSRFRPDPPNAKAVWMKPELVCEITYTEVTKDGVFRHPSFKGMRSDKKASEVFMEKTKDTRTVIGETENKEKTKSATKSREIVRAPQNKEKGTLLNPAEETQVKIIKNRELKFTHLSKVYWPEDGFTKRDMFNYYYQVAETILPYLKDRPQSLNRFPNGIHGKSFYQKNVKEIAPDWIKTYPYTSEGEEKEFLVITDEASLLWMASLGCIEMNPWFSRIQSDDYPDYCIIDLDPDQNTFDEVIIAAREVKKTLDSLDVPSYPKTSGSTGMHIYIPLGANYTYDQSQMFARLIVGYVHQQLPSFTSIERIISKRKGKMYLDFLQNRPGATVASPYSLRPKPGATVSMPLHWDEVKKGLKMQDFTIRNAVNRIKKEGDLYKGVLGEGINLEKVLKIAESQLTGK